MEESFLFSVFNGGLARRLITIDHFIRE